MKPLMSLLITVLSISYCYTQDDLEIQDSQASAKFTTFDDTGGSVITLKNQSDPGVFGKTLGTIEFETTTFILDPVPPPGKISYTTGFAGHTLTTKIGGANVMTLNQAGGLLPSLSMANGAICTQGGMWTNSCSAKLKNLNQNVDGGGILADIAQLPIYKWSYKSDPLEAHIGPTAEDFHDLFPEIGGDREKLAAMDLGGVGLAAIKELHLLANEQQNKIQALEAQVQSLLRKKQSQRKRRR